MNRALGVILAIPFIAIPVAMLSMLWEDSGFGGPPMAMKIAGTCICGAVAVTGLFIAIKAVSGKTVIAVN